MALKLLKKNDMIFMIILCILLFQLICVGFVITISDVCFKLPAEQLFEKKIRAAAIFLFAPLVLIIILVYIII